MAKCNNPNHAHGPRGGCRVCSMASTRRGEIERKTRDPESWRQYRREIVRKSRTPEKARKYKGLPVPTRPNPGVCEMPGCSRAATCLDHDHKTGAFRGWLCRSHNLALGKLGDNVEGLQRAIDYLIGETFRMPVRCAA